MYKSTYDNGALALKINNVEVPSSNIIDAVKLTYDSGTSELACGVVIIPTLEFTLLNTVSCVLMDTVSLSVGNIPFHSFIVVSANKDEYITKFKAYVEPYERLSKGFFGDLEDGYTVHSMLNEIATKTGITIDEVDSLPNLPLTRGDVTATGDDGSQQTQKGMNYSGKTYLEQLSLIGGFLGKNVIFTRDNHIKFTNLNSTDIVLTDLEKPSMKTNSYKVNKIVCATGKDTELISGSATLSETLSLSNCYMTQEQLNVLLAQFQAIEYEAFEFNHTQANLLIEPYDMVSFEYKGVNYTIPVQYLQIVFSSKGANYIVKSFVKQGESAVSEYKGTLTSRVDNVYTEVMQVRQLIANIGQFEEIEAVVGKIDNLYAKVGHIQNLLAGTITSEEINTIHLTSQNAVIDNAVVKSEMIESLAVSKLASGVIDTSKIQINSTNGHMTIADNTIRFIDSNGNTRLYMGEDTNGNFSYQVYNANGSGLLLDQDGLKEIAITDGLIKTNMINNEAITGDKINWTSFCESFNSDNTTTLDSAHITMDGKRLDTAFNQLNTTIQGQAETIDTHSAQLIQNANSIQGLVTATTITKEDGTTVGVKDEIANMKLTQDSFQVTISEKVDNITNATYTNLLENSDFLILDNDFPRGYSSDTHGDSSSVAISDWTLQGAKAIKISSSGKTDYHWISLFSPFVNTIEGQQFTASAWVATNSYSNVDEGCLIEIEWFSNDGNTISTSSYPFNPKVDTWERVAVTGWSPNGTTRARVRISVQKNGDLYATRLMLQTGEIATAWTKGGNFETISDRLSYAEQKITDDAITSTVAQNFYTKTETENAITSKGYATSSQVQQTAESITYKFSQSGGYNFVRNGNPKPWHEENWWVSGNGWWYRDAHNLGIQTHDTNEAYAGCATFKVQPETTYSFSCWVMAEANTNGTDVYFIGSEHDDGAYTEVHHLYNGAGNNLWANAKRTFTVGSNINYGFIRIDNNGRRDTSTGGSTVVFFSEVQMVKGSECYPQWSPNPNEVYDGIVQIDKNGLKVTSSDFGGYTHITSSGFYLNNGSKDIFSATRDGLKVFSDPNTSIHGDVIRSGNIVANNGDLTFDLNGGKLYYKYAYNQVGFLGITDGNSFSLSTAAKGWCMNSDYGSFSSMGAKSVNGGNYIPYLTVTSGGVSNYNAGIFMSMPLNYGSATGVNMTVKSALELSSKVSGAGLFNPKIAWRGTDVGTGAALFPRSGGDRIDIYTTGSSTKSDIYLRLADDVNTYFNITCNHYTYGHQSIASFRYVADINGYGIDFYRGLNMHNYNLGNVSLKNARSVQTASLALLDDEATVQTASPIAMFALDNDMEATQATITQHIATSINKTVTFNGTELVEGTSEYIELPQDFLMCVDIQVTLTPNKLCRFAVTSKDEFGFVIETDTEGVTFDYVVIGTKMDGTLFASLHDVEPDTKPVIDEEEEFVKYTTDNLMLPQEFIDKGYTTFADATIEEMEAMKTEQVFGSPVEENNKNKE